MPKRFIVKIDLARVQQSLSQADAVDWTIEDVRQWLERAGFTSIGDNTWSVAEPDLGQLDPSEVTILSEEP
jgi:hypothetical protein